MSDDEVLWAGNSVLYAHLKEEGFSDFETFGPSSSNQEHLKQKERDAGTKPDDNSYFGQNVSIVISPNEYKSIQCILNSNLMFKEDVDFVNAFLSNSKVHSSSSKYYLYTSFAACAFLTSTVLLKERINKFIIGGISSLLAGSSFWLCYKELKGSHDLKTLSLHISVLQSLCSSVHKLLRYLKESEILSLGQVTLDNIGSAVYISTQSIDKNELSSLPSWKTLPHVRKFLQDALVKIVNIFDTVSTDAKEISSPWIALCESYPLNTTTSLDFKSSVENNGSCVSIKDLQILNERYLVLQSEYLKWIAIAFCSTVWTNLSTSKFKKQKRVKQLIKQSHPTLSDISFKLMMQYNIHNMFQFFSKKACHPQKVDKLMWHTEKLNNVQSEVHNIFLLMLAVLLRVRSLEDYLEQLSVKEDDQINLNEDIIKQLATLKDDFTNASRCFDIICQQVVLGSKTQSLLNSPGYNRIMNGPEHKVEETGVVVGASDFSVNVPDEVFLAVSGHQSEIQDIATDDWPYEKKPLIPKNLLTELSNTLKLRKEEFVERERIALEKQGVQDICTSEITSDEESEGLLQKGKKKLKQKRNSTSHVHLGSSVSKDESPHGTSSTLKTYQCKYQYDSSTSSSDDDISGVDLKNVTSMKNDNQLSVANQIAIKSQAWGMKSEECFSDG